MLYKNEEIYRQKYKIIAGTDEAGRGPLAGPVVAAAVILDPDNRIEGLNDSKKLTEKKREALFDQIIELAVDWKVEIIPPETIDEINILQASLLGMENAIKKLSPKPAFCLIDGNKVPSGIADISEAMVKGDGRFASIAAASILAKVTRDRIMVELHQKYPQYNFAKNKGYPTKEHLQAIKQYGITPHHRKSYGPIQQLSFNFS